MKHALLLLLLAGLTLEAQAQNGRPLIGPSLKAQMRQQSDAPAAPDDARIGAVIYTRDVDALVAAGVEVQARFDGFVTARIHPDDLTRVAAIPGVKQIDDPLMQPDNDIAAAVSGVAALRAGLFGGTSYTGAGVLVCVIDSGIDWDHLDFRDPVDPMQSRIHSIWDQTITAGAGEAPPFGFAYGVEYTKADIEAALAGGTTLGTTDIDGHGTHVAGTAAGNGSSLNPAQHVGMAPEAELVIIKAGNGSFPTSNIVNGIDYCDNVATAAGKPAVINMSLGSQFGAHDGTDAKAVAATDFGANPGRVAVFSAGNEGASNLHISGATSDGATTTFTFTVPAYTASAGNYNDGMTFDLWYDGPGNVTAQLTTPGNTTYVQVAGSDDTYSDPEGEIYLFNFLDATNGDRRIYVSIDDGNAAQPPAAGTWTLEITNNDVAGMDFHGWIISNGFGDMGLEATLAGSDALYTLSNTPQGAITVASYVHRWRWCADNDSCWLYSNAFDDSDAISSFSSTGPTRDGRPLPHLAAPGQGMISSLSSDVGLPANHSRLMPGGQHMLIQGTSMAAPAVAGSIALLMQEDPTLDYARTAALLQGAADVDAATGAVPNDRWGAGKLDAFGAMTELVNSPLATYQVRSYNGPLASSTNLAPGEALSVRFEHSLGLDGRVLGVLFHPSSTVASTGTLSFSLFTDDGTGMPGTQLGSSVVLDAAQLQVFTWNYLDLSMMAVDLETDTDYHLVMRAVGTDVNTFIRHDGATTTNRSLKESAGTWTAQAFDWGVRPVVISTGIPLPVELVLFEGVREGERVVLSWMTATETNNAGFHVEASRGTEPWQTLGFVEGKGTRTEASQYAFTAQGLEAGTYRFRLKQVDFDGSASYSPEVEMQVEAPHVLALRPEGAHPAEAVQVRFTVPRRGDARVEAYDALGRRVGILFDGEAEAGQQYRATLDGLAAGVYVVRLIQGDGHRTLPFVITR